MTNPNLKTRKGSRNLKGIPYEVLEQLNKGTLETANLMEALAIDFGELIRSSLGCPITVEKVKYFQLLGIVQRMKEAALFLMQSNYDLEQLIAHPSDTVRGWAAYIISMDSNLSLEEKLCLIERLADDTHFGVREWAWLAMRPYAVNDPTSMIKQLEAWTKKSANLRRFASEITRPRGVWCAHISELKENPHLALSILNPLKSDLSRYVQNSVANWLNDAAKTKKQWVNELCQLWLQESQEPATTYICKRALRNCKS